MEELVIYTDIKTFTTRSAANNAKSKLDGWHTKAIRKDFTTNKGVKEYWIIQCWDAWHGGYLQKDGSIK